MENEQGEQLRLQLANIEQMLDTHPTAFTLSTLEDYISEVLSSILFVRDVPEETAEEKEAILEQLRQARVELALAIEEIEERGKTRTYYHCIEQGRKYLATALKIWK